MNKPRASLVTFALVALAGAASSCSSGGAKQADAPAPEPAVKVTQKIDGPSMADQEPVDMPGLLNVVAYHDGYWSGSVPYGDEGFATLAAMGVKTVISVDGAEPEVETATKYGIKYIHLPIMYSGFTEERKLELARATRDSVRAGPTYIHCHHGKHRSAGAAGAAAVSLGWATPEEMVARMKVSGTAAGYKGLYACTTNATPVSMSVLDAVPADFPEVAKPQGYVKGMVEIDHVTEHLKEIETAGWSVPKDHPDLVPVAEAGRMADLFRILTDDDYVARKPADFREMMKKNGSQAQTLEDWLVAGETDTKKLSDQFKLIVATCKECHFKYRD